MVAGLSFALAPPALPVAARRWQHEPLPPHPVKECSHRSRQTPQSTKRKLWGIALVPQWVPLGSFGSYGCRGQLSGGISMQLLQKRKGVLSQRYCFV